MRTTSQCPVPARSPPSARTHATNAPRLRPHHVGNRSGASPLPRQDAEGIERAWPFSEVSVTALETLQRSLMHARIDQTLIWALIDGGFGGTDLAGWLAEALLARLEEREPLPDAWRLLVLQALRDARAVWEPAFVIERARLRRHLQRHPGLLLSRLCQRLERPWHVPLGVHRTTPVPTPTPSPRHAACDALRQQWREWAGGPLPPALEARCMQRALRLNRQERGIWEPLVAVDPLREHLLGQAAHAVLLQRTHLTPSTPARSSHPLAARILAVAARARRTWPPGPVIPCGEHRGWAIATAGLVVCHPLLAAIASRPSAVQEAATPGAPPPPAARRQEADPAPWPLVPGTRAGALTTPGHPHCSAPTRAAYAVAASSAGPPIPPLRGGGLRPEEALRTVAPSFTDPVCARWLRVPGRSASDFSEGLDAVMRDANLTAPDALPAVAAAALFEDGDTVLARWLAQAEVPLFSRQLLARSSRTTRIFLFARAVSRLYARITPRRADDPSMARAAQWMQAVHDSFLDYGFSAPVRASVGSGDAAQWLGQMGSTPPPIPARSTTALTPADAAALFHRDPAGSVQALLAEVLDPPADAAAAQRWAFQLRGTERLTDWLESAAGRQRMAAVLQAGNVTLPALPPPDDAPLRLLQRAVRHHLPGLNATALATHLAQARHAPSPQLSLAATLRAHCPLLQAGTCLTHAAVLLAPRAWAAAAVPVMPRFPLPAVSANATLPAQPLDRFLRDCGLPLFEALDPTLSAAQVWALMAQTAAFRAAAPDATASPQAVNTAVAAWVLRHGLGEDRMATLMAGLDDAQARERPMQATRDALQEQLPALTHRTGRSLLWWLLVHHAGRPEWAVDMPAWLDHGRSLQSLTFLQGVGLVNAALPGASVDLDYDTLVGLPARAAARADRDTPDAHRLLVQALVRPALLYARAHGALHGDPGHSDANQVSAALAFVHQHQSALALATHQLAAPAPERRVLAADQLRAVGVPESYWHQTLDQIPVTTLRGAGIARREVIAPAPDITVVGLSLLVRSVEDAIARDSLLELLVGGVYDITGQPSIALSFEQAFVQYRQQMTAALAGVLDRALDMLPSADRGLLQSATVTPLRVPAGPRGVVLRCVPAPSATPSAPMYLAVIPSAGHAVRLATGDRFDGTAWTHGLLYDPQAFVSGQVADQIDPQALRLLDPDACTAGDSLQPPANGTTERTALLRAVAAFMYGDFFNRTRDAELARHTGRETLIQAEADFAEGLARFALPFYGCVRDAMDGAVAAAALECTLDAAGLLVPGGGLARFLRSTTALMVRGGELSAGALLRGAGTALLQLGTDLAAQSGLALLHDLGRGVLRLGRASRAWLLSHAPALQARLADEIAAGAALDGPLRSDPAVHGFDSAGACPRVKRQVNVPSLCTAEAITLFDYTPQPRYDTPGDVGWFAGMQVVSNEPFNEAGRAFLFDGEAWRQTRAGSGYRFVRDAAHPVPAPHAHIRATVQGGESQLLRVTLHAPYPGHLSEVTQGAVMGSTADGGRAVITRVAPGRFHVALLEGSSVPAMGQTLTFQPLERLGFSAAQNAAVKTAWWGAFHYSQQCRLSGAALVDRFGSQLQRQLEELADLTHQLDAVRAGSPFQFDNLPAQVVMSCAQSNCRYMQELRRQIGPALWRAPRAGEGWLDDTLRDLLSPPVTSTDGAAFNTLDDTLESRFLTPRRGPAKTLAFAELTLKDDPVPRVFHSSSGQRRGRGLLAIANLDARSVPAGWRVEGREVIAPHARYIDAQPAQVSINSGQVAGTVPNHSLHVEDLDGPLSNERNARTFDAERNLYYRIERYIADNRLDPSQVTGVRLFSSRRICASCHISVGSLRARLPGARFEVIERIPGTALDNGQDMAT